MKQADVKPRRRWIVIGPGLVLAVILAIQVMIANRPKPAGRPIIERQVIGSEVIQTATPAPAISYILERKQQLALGDRQVKALNALQVDWQSKSKPLSAELNKAAGEFNAFMKTAENKATMKDIQSHSGPVSELSRQVSSLRRVYWEKARQILSAPQQQTLDKELSRGYHPKSAQLTGGTSR